MDDCPRCQAPLVRFTLGDVETVTCTRCGFADVPVDHEREPAEVESWQDAFNRFYEKRSVE